MKIIVCISNHPGDLSFYYNLCSVAKRANAQLKVILVRVSHPYDANIDSSFYENSDVFNKIYRVGNVLYQRNIITGFKQLYKFNRQIHLVLSEIAKLSPDATFFISQSATYPMNKILKEISQKFKNSKVLRVGTSEEMKDFSYDMQKSFFASLYVLLGKAFPIYAVRNPAGMDLDYLYKSEPPGEKIRISGDKANAASEIGERRIPFPFPAVQVGEKKIVILFGDATFFEFFQKELLPIEQYENAILKIIKKFKTHYQGYTLWYKGHPLDGDRLMPGISAEDFKILSSKEGTAENLFDRYSGQIKAVYSMCSSASLNAAFRGIPAYVLYKLVLQDGMSRTRFDANIANALSSSLFAVEDLSDIGTIDDSTQNLPRGQVNAFWNQYFSMQTEQI